MNHNALIENVSASERGSRLVLSAALIGAVLAAPETMPAWVALLALYPAFTALLAWDPIYQLFARVSNEGNAQVIAPAVPVRPNTSRLANRTQ